MNICGIYKITSPSNKIYIGQTRNWQERLKDYIPNQCKPQIFIYNSLVKHGVNLHKFEIIHYLPEDISQEDLNNYEIIYWEQYKNLGFIMLNIREPGTQGKLSDETKIKISVAKKGRKLTEEHRKKCGSGRRGKKMDEEFCKNLSKIHKGKVSKYKGIPLSEETKKKLSESMKGKKMHTDESKRKIIESRKKNGFKTKAKIVLQLSLDDILIKEWPKASIAGDYLLISKNSISRACRNGNIYNNYKWKYK